MGLMKIFGNEESTVIGLCDLKKRNNIPDLTIESKTYILNKLFVKPAEQNKLFKLNLYPSSAFDTINL